MAPPLLLLVDDAPEIAQLVRILTRRAGQQFVSATDGQAALVLCQRPETPCPDLILIDLLLPGMNGIEFYRRLRKLGGRYQNLPAALFTQEVTSSAQAEALAAGIPFLVSKALLSQPDEWKQRIDEVLALAALPPDGVSWAKRLREKVALPGQLARDLASALQHPLLARLGEEVVGVLWSLAVARAGRQLGQALAGVDAPLTSAKVVQALAPLLDASLDQTARLFAHLEHQVACLLGRSASASVFAHL